MFAPKAGVQKTYNYTKVCKCQKNREMTEKERRGSVLK
jgi:hypothetical protein